MQDCLFCKIIAGQIPSTKVYEDDRVFAFRDISPQAPVHVLIVPKKHMPNILACDGETAAALVEAVRTVAGQEGLTENGFRVIGRPASCSIAKVSLALCPTARIACFAGRE